MATKKYLDYAGLQKYNQKLAEKYAPLASPALTGVPTAPTAATGTETTQIATTAFVQNAIGRVSAALVFKGVVARVTNLPAVVTSAVGDVYEITEKCKSTADFVEGAGKTIDAGSDVALAEVKTGVDYIEVTPEGTENPVEEGWYVSDGEGGYVLSEDTSVQSGTTYYEEVDVMGKKWDILGGVFDVSELQEQIDVRLTYGNTMPTEDLEDGQTFLYLGDTTYNYSPVVGITKDTNPSALGYFEQSGSGYAATSDTEPESVYKAWSDATITYFTKSVTPEVGDTVYTITSGEASDSGFTVETIAEGKITVDSTEFDRDAIDDEYISEKTYYTRAEGYVKGVIYVYNESTTSWVAQTAGDQMVPITTQEVDTLFK